MPSRRILLVLASVLLVLIATSMLPMRDAMIRPLETSAIAAIKTVHLAQSKYRSEYGRFASTLAELGPPRMGKPNASAAGLIGSDLAMGENGSYRFRLQASENSYAINAAPVVFNVTGRYTFYS